MRRHLQRCIGQETTQPVLKRALNNFGQKGFDRLAWRQCLFDTSNAGTHIGVEIAI